MSHQPWHTKIMTLAVNQVYKDRGIDFSSDLDSLEEDLLALQEQGISLFVGVTGAPDRVFMEDGRATWVFDTSGGSLISRRTRQWLIVGPAAPVGWNWGESPHWAEMIIASRDDLGDQVESQGMWFSLNQEALNRAQAQQGQPSEGEWQQTDPETGSVSQWNPATRQYEPLPGWWKPEWGLFPIDESGALDQGEGRRIATEMRLQEQFLAQDGEQPGQPQEQLLGWIDEAGWRIAEYGYYDEDGKKVVTRLEPLQPLQEPIDSIDDMIAKALAEVEDLSDLTDPNMERAQALFRFKTQPTAAERLQMALQIAQSPSDYLTLTALYTGELQRESPARWGEKVAPLMPFLQELAQQFFLDVPGITRELEPDVLQAKAQAQQDAIDEAQAQQDAIDEAQDWATGVEPTPGGEPTFVETPPSFDLYDGREPTIDEMEQFGGETIPLPLKVSHQGSRLPTFVPQQDLGFQVAPGTAPAGPFVEGAPQPFSTSHRAQAAQTGPVQELYPKPLAQGLFSPIADQIYRETLAKHGSRKRPESFHDGGQVPGPLGKPTWIQAEGGEMVLPNDREQRRKLLEQSGILGETHKPQAAQIGTFLTRPAKVQIPSLISGGFRFRSPQTLRRMTPTQQRLFQGGIESFGIPFEDFEHQESLATRGRGFDIPSLRFRPTPQMRR